MKDPILFAVTVVVILMTPGPTNTLLAASGVVRGFSRSLPLLIAEMAGYLTSIVAIGFLFDQILRIPGCARALKVAAAAYLLVLAVRMWRFRQDAASVTVSFGRVFVTTLLNPKALIFSLVVIPTREPNAAAYLASFLVILPMIGSIWIAFGKMIGRSIGSGHHRLIPKIVSIALTCFTASLILNALVY